MPNLRIAIGYRTEHRDPAQAVVLGTGTDKAQLQSAVDAAPADIVRFELGVFTPTGKATRNSNTTAIAAGAVETHDKTAPVAPVVPTFAEVIGKGYSPKAALKIVAQVTAQAAAFAANPKITIDDLKAIKAPEGADDLTALTVPQLKELCELAKIDVSECKVKADYIAAVELSGEPASDEDLKLGNQ